VAIYSLLSLAPEADTSPEVAPRRM